METIINRHFRNGMQIKLTAEPTHESPNSVYGQWRQVAQHQGGVTVQLDDRHGKTYWIRDDYPLSQLAREYAAQGRENPSKEAYRSMRIECESEVFGDMLNIVLSVSYGGIELAFDSICSPYYWETYAPIDEHVRETAAEYFNLRELLREAKREAANLSEKLSSVA